jgi:hypothetical protein
LKTQGTNWLPKLRDYSANKVVAIRKGFWGKYAPEEYKAYGNAIENLPLGNKNIIDGSKVVQNLEKTLFDRGLMTLDESTGQLVLNKGFTPADNKLIKAYQNVSRKWANSSDGNLAIKDIVEEYKGIKGKHIVKPTSTQRKDIEAANDFFNTASDQINTEKFTEAKLRYRGFKENQQIVHEAIDLYAPEMKTAKGERWLMGGAINKTTQARKTAQIITEKTGQNLRGAKGWTKLNDVNPLNLIRRR